jgi:diaminopimelate decarboxylase
MDKKKYERPTIVRHMTGFGNKFGRAQKSRIKKEIDGVLVKDLIRHHGSPVFVFSEKTIRMNFRRALNTFSVRYPKVQFAWSYKTNYLDAVCRIFHQEGSWAEVVSEFEYDMAKNNGIVGEKIIYNGPYKPEAALYTAVHEGARIHMDHYDELYLLERISKDIGKPIDVGIRVNMDTGIYPSWDRFGFNLDNGEAMNAVRRIQAGGKLRLTGLHSHIGTFVTEPAAYRNESSKLAAFAASINREFGFIVDYIDVGGGFASKNTLHAQYAPGRESNPTIDAYAEAVTSGLLEHGFPPDKLPMLILETGRALIDEAGYLLTTVIGNKRLPNGSRAMIVDAGVNLLFTSTWYKHDVMLSEEKEGIMEETVIYGPLCMNIDVIRPAVNLPVMDSGDILVIHPVGAYNVTQWMQFIRMRPAVVLVGENQLVDVIREAESLDMVKTPEHVPERLKNVCER